MKYTKSDIQALIAQGEHVTLEFKQEEVKAGSLAKELIAFANQNGGIILLGIADDGRFLGISKDRNHEEWVDNIARNNVIPSLQVQYSSLCTEGKEIAVISIPKGQDKPYQSLDGKYFIRVGSTNRIATQQELLRLFQASGAFHYDKTCVFQTSWNDLNFAKIDQFFKKYSLDFSTENETEKRRLLENTDILSENGEVTLGGLLIFGINPSRYLPQSGISFACFSGTELAEELLNKQNIDGTLDYLVDTGVAIIKNHLKIPSIIQQTLRKDTRYIYPGKVFRELITNAVIHRNYSITGSKIRIFLFEDRLEIRSPGRLPNSITPEKLRYGVSFAVNPILVKFMENLRYIDHLGRGIPMVYHEANTHGKSVLFEEFGEEFKVTLEL